MDRNKSLSREDSAMSLPMSPDNYEPNKESLEAIRETEELIAKGGPGYSSAAEMFAAMGI